MFFNNFGNNYILLPLKKKFNMKKTSYTLSAFLFILTLIIASCDKEEDQEQPENCLAVGTWSLSHITAEDNDNGDINCAHSCIGLNQLPSSCTYTSPFYGAGCVTLTISENRTYIISDQNGWSVSDNWIGNCGVGEQISVPYDFGLNGSGESMSGLITSLSPNELKIQNINALDCGSTTIYHFIK